MSCTILPGRRAYWALCVGVKPTVTTRILPTVNFYSTNDFGPPPRVSGVFPGVGLTVRFITCLAHALVVVIKVLDRPTPPFAPLLLQYVASAPFTVPFISVIGARATPPVQAVNTGIMGTASWYRSSRSRDAHFTLTFKTDVQRTELAMPQTDPAIVVPIAVATVATFSVASRTPDRMDLVILV